MYTSLFVISLLIVFNYLLNVVAILCGRSMRTPIPLLHLVDISFSNIYLTTPAIAYQIYFWANYSSILP